MNIAVLIRLLALVGLWIESEARFKSTVAKAEVT
jgi:hypothetical protein